MKGVLVALGVMLQIIAWRPETVLENIWLSFTMNIAALIIYTVAFYGDEEKPE